MARKIGAIAYIESSAATMDGVRNVRKLKKVFQTYLALIREFLGLSPSAISVENPKKHIQKHIQNNARSRSGFFPRMPSVTVPPFGFFPDSWIRVKSLFI